MLRFISARRFIAGQRLRAPVMEMALRHVADLRRPGKAAQAFQRAAARSLVAGFDREVTALVESLVRSKTSPY